MHGTEDENLFPFILTQLINSQNPNESKAMQEDLRDIFSNRDTLKPLLHYLPPKYKKLNPYENNNNSKTDPEAVEPTCLEHTKRGLMVTASYGLECICS